MTRYLISFPAGVMDVPDGDWVAVGEAAHAVVQEAKDAGVYVFTGGLDDDVQPVTVAADGTVTDGGSYPQFKDLSGGHLVVEVPTREEAVTWAAKIAVACRCPQELRQWQYDPLI